MNWKSIVFGAGLGFTAGYLVASKLQESRHLSSEKALRLVKDAFMEKGEVTGSWIHLVPEAYEKFDLTYEVYRGGITVLIDGLQERFEFLTDAKTGSILEVIPS